MERANELGHVVLQNKQYQRTWFVRALLRAGTAGLRNLPTIHHIINEDYEVCVKTCKNTQGAELNKTLTKIRSAKNIMMILGIMEILEIYAVASLASQNSL